MAKEIERAGFPVVVMANLIDVAKTVGSNRIVPTTSVPYPLGEMCIRDSIYIARTISMRQLCQTMILSGTGGNRPVFLNAFNDSQFIGVW